MRVNIADHEYCKSSPMFPEHFNGAYWGRISAIERRDGQLSVTGASVTWGNNIPGVKEPSLPANYSDEGEESRHYPRSLGHVGSNTRSPARQHLNQSFIIFIFFLFLICY